MRESAQPRADLLPVQRAATPMFRVIRLLSRPLLHALFRVTIDGRGNIPEQQNYVLIANHLNWLDSFLILDAFPIEPRIHFLGDTTILITRRLQWALVKSVAGFIPVNRRVSPDNVLFAHVKRCLERGGIVAVYPEGNYGPREGDLMPLRRGFAHFAIEGGVPVLPVAISGTRDLWLRKPVRLIIGAPIETSGQTVESLVAMADAALRRLLPAYRDPGGIKLARHALTHLF
jgi:1-acyl-sn-glycerol-3-phosphate acyltransferase